MCVKSALNAAGLDSSDLAAVGITNQRESTLVWDRKTGTPLHRLIVWNDARTEPICRYTRGSAAAVAAGARSRWFLLQLLLVLFSVVLFL